MSRYNFFFIYISRVCEIYIYIDVTQNHLFREVILTHRATHSLIPTVHSKKLRQKKAKENFDLRTFNVGLQNCASVVFWLLKDRKPAVLCIKFKVCDSMT